MRTRSVMTLAALALAATTLQAQGVSKFSTLPALDYFQIKQLYARYVHGLDSGANNGNLFADAFTPDGVLIDESGKTTSGRAGLAALARATGKGPTHVVHFETNLLISPAPGGATGRSYIQSAVPGPAGQPSILSNDGQFQDELVKTAEGWRFKKREFHPSPLERRTR